MPNDNAQNPPYWIFPGDVALAFNNEASAAGQASQQFALPSFAGFPENGRAIRWQVSFATTLTAVMPCPPGCVRTLCGRKRCRRDGANLGLKLGVRLRVFDDSSIKTCVMIRFEM
jgi:hypothetical protein